MKRGKLNRKEKELINIRRKAGATDEEIAKKMGLDVETVKRVEKWSGGKK
jgi:hypothetical protein